MEESESQLDPSWEECSPTKYTVCRLTGRVAYVEADYHLTYYLALEMDAPILAYLHCEDRAEKTHGRLFYERILDAPFSFSSRNESTVHRPRLWRLIVHAFWAVPRSQDIVFTIAVFQSHE